MENRKFILIAVTITFFIYLIGGTAYLKDFEMSNLGTLGDFIGGSLNPILSFLTFLILIKTIKYQKDALETSTKELTLTREELELTRAEVKRSADTQEKSKKVQEQQAKTQLSQQFENTFFSLLEQIRASRPSNEEISQLTIKCCSLRHQSIQDARKALQVEREKHSHFFRLIYQTLNFLYIKEKDLDFIDTKVYKNILRSILTPNDTILLALNSAIIPKFLETDSFTHYKYLIEKYSMLQHMPLRSPHESSNSYLGNNNYTICQTLGCYEKNAFEDNIYLKSIEKTYPKIIQEIKILVSEI